MSCHAKVESRVCTCARVVGLEGRIFPFCPCSRFITNLGPDRVREDQRRRRLERSRAEQSRPDLLHPESKPSARPSSRWGPRLGGGVKGGGWCNEALADRTCRLGLFKPHVHQTWKEAPISSFPAATRQQWTSKSQDAGKRGFYPPVVLV